MVPDSFKSLIKVVLLLLISSFCYAQPDDSLIVVDTVITGSYIPLGFCADLSKWDKVVLMDNFTSEWQKMKVNWQPCGFLFVSDFIVGRKVKIVCCLEKKSSH